MSAVDFEYCKDEAIAFGEWLRINGYCPIWSLGTEKGGHFFTEPVWHQNLDSSGKTFTTEELYDIFLKSRV